MQVEQLAAVWISHRHADHMMGLAAILCARPPAAGPLLVRPSTVMLNKASLALPLTSVDWLTGQRVLGPCWVTSHPQFKWRKSEGN